MAHTIFITGGAKSGKSLMAEELALRYGSRLGYLATGTAGDAEMAARIDRHRKRRGSCWETVEEPVDIVGVLVANEGKYEAILVDCITLWLTNLLLKYGDPAPCLAAVRSLGHLIASPHAPLILVSNEVGMGIVPDNALARSFRDVAGEANELLAAAADEVYVMFSGLPLKLKG